MGRLLRRFLVILMKRIAAFCHGQQLTVPLLFFGVFVFWQFITRRLTWESLLKNPWNEFMPYLATLGLLLVIQIALAVRDLNRELVNEVLANPPKIIHTENQLRLPSMMPARLIGTVLVGFICGAEAFVVERAYPVDTMPIPIMPAPRPPAIAPLPQPDAPESGFMGFDNVTPNESIIEAGRRFSFNVQIMNGGNFPVRHKTHLFWGPIRGSELADRIRVLTEFDKKVTDRKKQYLEGVFSGSEIAKGSGTWATIGTILSDEQATGLLDGTLHQYILWWAIWQDPRTADPSSQGCMWLQTPRSKDLSKEKLIWQHCSE